MTGNDSYLWSPSIGEPWAPNYPSTGLPYTPPMHPLPMPTQPMLPPLYGSIFSGSTETDTARLAKKLDEYRFLVKAIRNLANAGKVEPAAVLAAIDALLMALDDEYDKHEPGTVPDKTP
jgi:hypothetical protein